MLVYIGIDGIVVKGVSFFGGCIISYYNIG